MSIISACLRELIAAGVTGEALVAAVERIEAAGKGTTIAKEKRSERNRKHYQKRLKASENVLNDEASENVLKRLNSDADLACAGSRAETQLPLERDILEEKKKEKNIVQLKNSDAWPRDYREQFWSRFPRREGKRAVFAKLEVIRKRGDVTFADLMAGVDRYLARKLEPQFTKQPLTWLNQGCWADETVSAPNGQTPAVSEEELERQHAARMEEWHALMRAKKEREAQNVH